jgi:hypothetical protein
VRNRSEPRNSSLCNLALREISSDTADAFGARVNIATSIGCWMIFARTYFRSSEDRKELSSVERWLGRRNNRMDELNLPRHIVERVEKRWAQKLQAQVDEWRSSAPNDRSSTERGVPVVRRRMLPKKGARKRMSF